MQILSLRVPEEFFMEFNAAVGDAKGARTDALREALTDYLAKRKRPVTVATPTPEQRQGMRLKALSLLQRGGEWCPEDAAPILGCNVAAAGKYMREWRKKGLSIPSRQIMREGKYTSVYWLEVTGNE